MDFIQTNRLLLTPITIDDSDFINKLLNCPGFLRFIGDRNVRSRKEAEIYISNMLANPDITYWVVRILENHTPIGVVTWVKRDFLPVPDLGYAILPEFEGNGYATEASQAWLHYHQKTNKSVLAICQADNLASIKLLQKLSFERDLVFEKDGQVMHQYHIHQ